MQEIFATENFTVQVPSLPHVSRADGGHVVIWPKTPVPDRTRLSPAQATELMRLTMVVGVAMTTALQARGVPIGRINYQDNGNWGVGNPGGPTLHLHLYGRSKTAKVQTYGEALRLPHPATGFYRDCKPLNTGDIAAIRKKIADLLRQLRYADAAWGLHRPGSDEPTVR